MSAQAKKKTNVQNGFAKVISLLTSSLKNVKENSASGLLKPALLLVVFLLIASILISLIIPKGGNDPFLYVKNGELYYASSSSTKGKAVTTGQLNTEQNAVLTADGSGIFYKDQLGDELCYKNTKKLKKAPLVISKEVFEFSVCPENSIVTYVKGIDRELYQHDLKKQSSPIDKHIVLFYVSGDGNNIIYTKYNDNGASELWFYTKGDAPKLIVADFDNTYGIADDCLSLIYTKDNAAYRFKHGKDDEKLIENCSEIIACYDSGEIYYCCYSGDSGIPTPALYFYDGKKSEKIADSYSGNVSYASKSPVLIYYSSAENATNFAIAVNGKSSPVEYNISSAYIKPDGNEVYFIADTDANTRQGVLYKAAISGKSMKKAKEVSKDVYRGKYLDDDKFIYFKNYELGLNLADMYIGRKKIAEKVGPDSVLYNYKEEDIIYFTDVDTFAGTLNIYGGGKKKVAENVHIGQTFITENGNVIYMKDFNATEGVGDLYLCKSRRGTKIGEKVSFVFRYDTSSAKDAMDRGYY